jgi:hypothetical protein
MLISGTIQVSRKNVGSYASRNIKVILSGGRPKSINTTFFR